MKIMPSPGGIGRKDRQINDEMARAISEVEKRIDSGITDGRLQVLMQTQ